MTTYTQHPLSAAFPSMPGHEVDALAADIKANGQREPATIYEGMILDGWHRYRACSIAGVVLLTREFPKDADPVSFVKSRNLHRRHLTDSQRAAAVVACSKWAPAGNPKPETGRGSINPAPGAELKAARASATTAEMAREADVSPRTINHAKVAQDAGLGEVVREGKVSAKRAAEIVKADPKIATKIASGKVTPEEAIAKAKPLPKILPRPEQKAKPAEDDGAPDLAELVDEIQSENTRLSAMVQAAQANDLAAEAMKWRAAYDRALASQSEAMDAAARSEKREKFTKAQLMRCGRAVGEDDPRKIAAAVEAALRKKAA